MTLERLISTTSRANEYYEDDTTIARSRRPPGEYAHATGRKRETVTVQLDRLFSKNLITRHDGRYAVIAQACVISFTRFPSQDQREDQGDTLAHPARVSTILHLFKGAVHT